MPNTTAEEKTEKELTGIGTVGDTGGKQDVGILPWWEIRPEHTTEQDLGEVLDSQRKVSQCLDTNQRSTDSDCCLNKLWSLVTDMIP